MARRRLLTILVLLAPAVRADAAEPLARYEQSQVHMGTQFRIVLYAPDDAVATKSAKAAFARIAELDALLSDYRDDSALTWLSRSSGGSAVPVNHELFGLLERSVEFSKLSSGAFDVTAGPVIRIWRRARRLRELPTQAQIDAAMARVGYSRIVLDATGRTVRLTTPNMLLDLGGIAKGYACDQALAALCRHGVTRALVDGGGDVSVGEPPPGKPGWTVAVAPLEVVAIQTSAPAGSQGPPAASVVLANAAIATSGDTARFVDLGGKRFSHIVDPRTGWALASRLQVTVIAPDGTTADSLATAVSVLGPSAGIELVDSNPQTAALVIQAVDGGIRTFASRRWQDRHRDGEGNP